MPSTHCHSLSPELPLLTVSAGVAEYPSCASQLYALLDSADHALCVAQAQGKNRSGRRRFARRAGLTGAGPVLRLSGEWLANAKQRILITRFFFPFASH